jgi:prepilin-type N-terminal cleavage/methylation domain-containing protein
MRGRRAFTLVEIMIVVIIIGITVAVGVPAFVRTFEKNPLQQAEADLLAMCGSARLSAITQQRPVDLVVRLLERSFALQPVEVVETPPVEGEEVDPPKPVALAPPFVLAREVQFAVTASSQSFEDEREVRVRFFPDGTCEDLRVKLESGHGRRILVLEVATALVEVQNPD